MKLSWAKLMEQIAGLGYRGEDNLEAVKAWLGVEFGDSDTVQDADGNEYDLATLYKERKGKRLDVTEAVKKSEAEEIAAGMLREMVKSGAVPAPNQRDTEPMRHDVKVGKDRLADDPTGGFKSWGEFLSDVAKSSRKDGFRTEKMAAWEKATGVSTYSGEDVGADGGFAAPMEYADAIYAATGQGNQESLLSRCNTVTLSKSGTQIPIDPTPEFDNSNGIITYWEGEGQEYNLSKLKLESKEWRPRKLTALVPVSEELLEDSSAIGTYINMRAPEKMRFEVDNAIMNGSGAGRPEGYLNSSALVTITKETNQGASTLTPLNIVKMYQAMYARWRGGCVWVANQGIEPELYLLSQAGRASVTATGYTAAWGSHMYLPPGGLSQSPYGSLMGRPIIFHEACPALGSAGDLQLVNLNQYLVALKSPAIDAQTSMHVWFDQDLVAYRFRFRVDGKPYLRSKIDAKNGTVDYSAFVALGARA